MDYETTVTRYQLGVDESGEFHILNGGVLNTGTAGDTVGNNNVCTGTLTIDAGGTVNSGAWVKIGADAHVNGGVTGVANISGTFNMVSHLWMGASNLTTGFLNIGDGGVVNVGGNIGLGTGNASTASGGTGTITVSMGGLLNLHQWSNTTSIQDGSVLNINQGGVVIVGGNRVDSANNYFTAGKIASDLGDILATFDSGANLTTITAIPEPATLGLLGMVGALGFLRRRRS